MGEKRTMREEKGFPLHAGKNGGQKRTVSRADAGPGLFDLEQKVVKLSGILTSSFRIIAYGYEFSYT